MKTQLVCMVEMLTCNVQRDGLSTTDEGGIDAVYLPACVVRGLEPPVDRPRLTEDPHSTSECSSLDFLMYASSTRLSVRKPVDWPPVDMVAPLTSKKLMQRP